MYIGSKDVAKAKYNTDDIVYHIMAHAEALRDLNCVKAVIICSLINRDIGMGISPVAFQKKVCYE